MRPPPLVRCATSVLCRRVQRQTLPHLRERWLTLGRQSNEMVALSNEASMLLTRDAVPTGAVDRKRLPKMRSGEIRHLAESAAENGADPKVWEALAEQCMIVSDTMNYWDIVMVLQAFTKARVENRDLFIRLGEAVSNKTSKLAPKHVLDIFAVFEAQGIRPRALYVELFHSVIRLSRSMYAEELSITLQALARYGLGNPTVMAHLVHSIRQQLPDMRLRYLCSITGALASINACDHSLLTVFDAKAEFEVQTIPLPELLANVQAFPQLEYSWRPYEEKCMEELLLRTRHFSSARDMDQFADPFQALRLFHARGYLHDAFLESLIQWCLVGVHRANVRSERRPTSRQLAYLYEMCRERGLENSAALKDALQYYMESGGGIWPRIMPKPLKYHKRRSYFHTYDPLKGTVLPSLVALQPSTSGRVESNDLPGLPSSVSASPTPENTSGLPIDAPRNVKPSQASPLLAEEESSVRCWARSRKSPRPRHRRDPGLKKMLRPDMPRGPLWFHGGWGNRPKYQQGTITKNNPWKGVPYGNNGAKRILRR